MRVSMLAANRIDRDRVDHEKSLRCKGQLALYLRDCQSASLVDMLGQFDKPGVTDRERHTAALSPSKQAL
jgi:hypothetical protein